MRVSDEEIRRIRRQLESGDGYVGSRGPIFTDVFRFLPVPSVHDKKITSLHIIRGHPPGIPLKPAQTASNPIALRIASRINRSYSPVVLRSESFKPDCEGSSDFCRVQSPSLLFVSFPSFARSGDRGSPARCLRISTGDRALHDTPLYQHHQNRFGHPRDRRSRIPQRKCFFEYLCPNSALRELSARIPMVRRVLAMRSFWMG